MLHKICVSCKAQLRGESYDAQGGDMVEVDIHGKVTVLWDGETKVYDDVDLLTIIKLVNDKGGEILKIASQDIGFYHITAVTPGTESYRRAKVLGQ